MQFKQMLRELFQFGGMVLLMLIYLLTSLGVGYVKCGALLYDLVRRLFRLDGLTFWEQERQAEIEFRKTCEVKRGRCDE